MASVSFQVKATAAGAFGSTQVTFSDTMGQMLQALRDNEVELDPGGGVETLSFLDLTDSSAYPTNQSRPFQVQASQVKFIDEKPGGGDLTYDVPTRTIA